jgi:hypothetical protein
MTQLYDPDTSTPLADAWALLSIAARADGQAALAARSAGLAAAIHRVHRPAPAIGPACVFNAQAWADISAAANAAPGAGNSTRPGLPR